MRLVTASEMRELDRRAIEEFGIPGLVLMENAGRQVAEVVKEMLGGAAGKRVAVFAGKGNNGGDGLV
ncbi:MAG: NAD(P)H-hydrate epimerase, partial [Desulfotomaculales bacterium]